MAWELKDEHLLERVAASTAPPADIRAILADELWTNVFSMWATDRGWLDGDYIPSRLYRLSADLNYGTPGETIRARYVEPSGELAVQWPAVVLDRFERVANGMDSDYSGALTEIRNAATETLETYVSRFRDDISQIQASHVSDPKTPDRITLGQIDTSFVDRVNQAELKDLIEYKEATTKGTIEKSQVKFYASTELVLIGDNHSGICYDYLNMTGHSFGTITMMQKGGAFGAGRVEVAINGDVDSGGKPGGVRVLPDQGDIRKAITEAIGRVSNKEVKHRS